MRAEVRTGDTLNGKTPGHRSQAAAYFGDDAGIVLPAVDFAARSKASGERAHVDR